MSLVDFRTAPKALLALTLSLLAWGSEAQTISGRVTNAATASPVAGADLDVFDQTGTAVTITGGKTASDGTYTLTLPGPGTYRVRVDMSVGDPLADQYYGGGIKKSLAPPILVANAGTAITGIDFALDPGYSLSGQLLSSGVPLASVDLDLYSADGEFLSSYPGTSAVDGRFEIGPLPNGTYYLASDPDPALGQLYVNTFFGDVSDLVSASPITISNASVLGNDIHLPEGGLIAGTIRNSAAAPLAGIDLDLFDSLGQRVSFNASSLADGTYTMGALPAGTYYLRADPSILSGYARALYPAALRLADATPITVVANQTTSGIDFALADAGTISGTMRDQRTQAPLANVDLDIFDEFGIRVDFNAKTGIDGTYRLGPMPAGQYIVRSDPANATAYVGAYYDSQGIKSLAQTVSVVAGAETANIDFALAKGGWISGIIKDLAGTPLSGIDLDVYDSLGVRQEANAQSAVDGTYQIGPLPVGSYTLRADPGVIAGYMTTFYQDTPNRTDATPIAVTSATTTSGIDFALPEAGWIEGTIRDELGTPLSGIDLDIYDAITQLRVAQNATSDATGRYIIGPLPVSQYMLRADPRPDQYRTREYYLEQETRASATAIGVTSKAGQTGIDFSLVPGASLSGIALSAVDNSPIVGADIDVYRVSDMARMDQSAKTQADGSYLVGPLPQGTYIVRIDALIGTPYADTYYGNVSDPSLATPIVITPNSDTTALDVSLPPNIIYDAFSPSVSLRRQGSDTIIDISFPTETGLNYFLQRSDTLLAPSWQSITSVPGDGLSATLSDTYTSVDTLHFYRIQAKR